MRNQLPIRVSCCLLGLSLILGCVGGDGELAHEGDERRDAALPRHLLLLTVDTLRADHMSVYGYERATTPFLERLAEESLTFERAIVQWPKTGTSFASMFIGRYPQSTGITHKAAVRVPEELPVLPEALQQAGFRTLAVVSNAVLSRELGWDRGFDEYVQTWDGNPTEDPVEYRALLHAGRVNELAFDLLNRHPIDADEGDQRLFLWVHYSDPHAPYILPAGRENPFLADEKFEAQEAVEVDLEGTQGKAIGDATDLRFYRAQYDANILEVDRALEAMLDELGRRGYSEQALTVITADHGESLGEHELYFEHGPLPYNPSARVPLMLEGRGISAGERIAEPVELVGLVPTLQQFFPQALRPAVWSTSPLEGASWPLRTADAPAEAVAFAEAGRAGRRHYRSVQDASWKLVFKPPRESRRAVAEDYELYDLRADPLEETSLVEQHPEQVRRLRDLIGDWMERTALGQIDDSGEGTDPEALRALKAMGYVQ